VWIDRWSRRRTMLLADVVRAVALLTVPLAAPAQWTNSVARATSHNEVTASGSSTFGGYQRE